MHALGLVAHMFGLSPIPLGAVAWRWQILPLPRVGYEHRERAIVPNWRVEKRAAVAKGGRSVLINVRPAIRDVVP